MRNHQNESEKMLKTMAAFMVPRKSICVLQQREPYRGAEGRRCVSRWDERIVRLLAAAEGRAGYSPAAVRDRHDVLAGAGHPQVGEDSDGQRDEVEGTRPAARSTHPARQPQRTRSARWDIRALRAHPLKLS